MNVIFLDVDGVLTSARVDGFQTFDKYAVEFVNFICQKAPCKVVISSTWRSMGGGEEFFKGFFGENLHEDWSTTFKRMGERGKEIQEWLDRHPETENYLILDDDSDMLDSQKENFIKTDTYNGLLFEHMIGVRGHFNITERPIPKKRHTT